MILSICFNLIIFNLVSINRGMKYRIVFILNSIQHQRCVKGIQEFICRGYEVEIYGFSRGNEDFNKSLSEMRPIVLAQFDNSTSFRKSFSLMYHSLSTRVIRRSSAWSGCHTYIGIIEIEGGGAAFPPPYAL